MSTPSAPEQSPGATPETVGKRAADINVQLGAQFLHHFSEQLYSSPQKAFEELISNGWDAGADHVDVRTSADLSSASAVLCVMDNGVSMDLEGLRNLWHVAFSPKKGKAEEHGRKIIGQFGIGKLATYVLAKKLTYICRASDGKIRRVTMDYGDIDRNRDSTPGLLLKDIPLGVFEASFADLQAAIEPLDCGAEILRFIGGGGPCSKVGPVDNEFGGDSSAVVRASTGTWTLVVLSELKPAGRELKMGVLKRMLEAALPFGSAMAICLNGKRLVSSKVDAEVKTSWTIGPELDLAVLEIEDEDQEGDEEALPDDKATAEKDEKPRTIPLSASNAPYPHVNIPGVGIVTGRVSLFSETVSGKKSDQYGASNGFHVNVLGRLVNQGDSSFGEKNLSHAAWARFRMAVRADGLNPLLAIDREKMKDSRELKIFKSFLRQVFNKVRVEYDSDPGATLSDGGDLLVKSLGVLSLDPLRNVVSETLREKSPPIPGLIDDSGIPDRAAKRRSWREGTSDNIKNALGEVKFEKLNDDSFVKFRVSENAIVVNKDHPFFMEHSRTKAEKELLRTVAMVHLLSDVYALDQGVDPTLLVAIRRYRDRLMRIEAMKRRKSGFYIANLLLTIEGESDWRMMKIVVADALRYLGFEVKDVARPGQPEGIARAYPFPTKKTPSDDEPEPPLYAVTFDAEPASDGKSAVENGLLNEVAAQRDRVKADHALVIVSTHDIGDLKSRFASLRVTPMVARDLGRLLEYTVEHGAIPLTKLREVLLFFEPSAVSKWVDDLPAWLVESRPLTMDVFLKALEKLRGKIPDALSAGTLAYACRELLKAVSVRNEDVISLAKGLAVLIPDLVGVEGDKIVVNASPTQVADSVRVQLEKLRN